MLINHATGKRGLFLARSCVSGSGMAKPLSANSINVHRNLTTANRLSSGCLYHRNKAVQWEKFDKPGLCHLQESSCLSLKPVPGCSDDRRASLPMIDVRRGRVLTNLKPTGAASLSASTCHSAMLPFSLDTWIPVRILEMLSRNRLRL
jgi:hypothetical protein